MDDRLTDVRKAGKVRNASMSPIVVDSNRVTRFEKYHRVPNSIWPLHPGVAIEVPRSVSPTTYSILTQGQKMRIFKTTNLDSLVKNLFPTWQLIVKNNELSDH